MKTTQLLIISSLVMLAASCSDSKFNAGERKREALTRDDPQEPKTPTPAPTPTPDPKQEEGGPLSYALNCDKQDPLTVELKSKADRKIKINGEFCPKSYGKLNVLFVVDFSGSMGPHMGLPGSDPGSFFTQSCGRRKAVESIIAKLKADMRANDDINVGLIQFGNDARVAQPLSKIASFENSAISYRSLCGSNLGATNYEAALKRTKESLANIDGNKVVFFVSDGLPTAYLGGDPSVSEEEISKQKGQEAAKELATETQNLSLNVVYLSGENKNDSISYLAELTGDKNRVKVADNAELLAEKIVELSIPSVLINKETISAELVFGTQKKAIKIVKIEEDATRPSVWVFESEEFTALGKTGSEALNQISIKVMDSAKVEHKQRIDIKFTGE